MNHTNDYYVYIYWRLDTNEPFYIGMGCGNRWKNLKDRNIHFKRIIDKHLTICEMVKDNLTEEQAHDIECWLINELVFEYGYSIDIKNNRSKNEKNFHLVNQTWGGEGTSGLDWREFMSDKELEEHNKKLSKSLRATTKNKKENHWNYGQHWDKQTKEIMSKKKKGLYDGKNNPRAKAIICLTTIKIFSTIKEGAEYYDILKIKNAISRCCKGKQNSCGKLSNGEPLKWMYLEDFLKKCFYIKL